MEGLGFWAALVLLELRQGLLRTGAAATEVGDSIMFTGVRWKVGMLTAFSSGAVTGMTPETEKSGVEGDKSLRLEPLCRGFVTAAG